MVSKEKFVAELTLLLDGFDDEELKIREADYERNAEIRVTPQGMLRLAEFYDQFLSSHAVEGGYRLAQLKDLGVHHD